MLKDSINKFKDYGMEILGCNDHGINVIGTTIKDHDEIDEMIEKIEEEEIVNNAGNIVIVSKEYLRLIVDSYKIKNID